ncbi:hypothetical protein PL11_009730 [Lentilactobacillus curieae]|uniref:Bacterial type II secretion system protein E domain-containing protein n=2 Tax=Lentilactobacillus curieae TaxID=1138822 RepID=A0A1S6QKP7_9LACO|nr:hypothetical protein PL11_009730 [Lentilactobacillus curieae]
MDAKVFFNQMITKAIESKTSDIYFMWREDSYQVLFRGTKGLDGYLTLNMQNANQVINYCKYAAEMSISERRRPQAGRLSWHEENKKLSLRISTVGDVHSHESLVIRLIYDWQTTPAKFVNTEEYEKVSRLCQMRGLIVFPGPTGSGKTTTIYQLASSFSKQQIVMAIEDPVEVYQNDFLQLQVNNDAGLSYMELIKVGLRHRPDVFIIGEIRDFETANAAVQAALSGHLVLTTVHAQSPTGVIQRLLNLGIESGYLEQALTGIVYQRLLNTNSGSQKGIIVGHSYEELNHENYDWSTWQQYLQKGVAEDEVSIAEAEEHWYG